MFNTNAGIKNKPAVLVTNVLFEEILKKRKKMNRVNSLRVVEKRMVSLKNCE